MKAASTSHTDRASRIARRRRSITMVFGCTILGAVGQILIKKGANTLAHPTSLLALLTQPSQLIGYVLAMLTTPTVFFGYVLYGLMTVLFVFALRDEELSILYPIISLTYVWVAALSAVFFGDSIGWVRMLGIITIVVGVAVLGKDGRK